MRYPKLYVLTGVALAALSACSDSLTSGVTAPDPSGAKALSPTSALASKGGSNDDDNKRDDDKKGDDDSKNGNKDREKDHGDDKDHDKITICHAAGRAGTTKYVKITVSSSASYAHIDEHGTPRAGHEEDYYAADDDKDCGSKPTPTVTKTLTGVMTTLNGAMVPDPTWSLGKPVIIPRGETRWLFYTIDYTVPTGTGTLSENPTTVCATLGAGFHCSFNTGGQYSWTVNGSKSKELQIDITNQSVCGDRTFVNTVTLTSGGKTVTATATTPLKLTCPTPPPPVVLTKKLTRVFSAMLPNGTMVDDPNWKPGQTLVIPVGETRWLHYEISYTLPTGVTATVLEDTKAVCGATPTGTECGFADWPAPVSSTGGVLTWSSNPYTTGIAGGIDIKNQGACTERDFVNTVTLKLSNGQTLTASATVHIKYECQFTKKLTHVYSAVNPDGTMKDDPTWTLGGTITIPRGQTRWLHYELAYVLPNGTTATITEDATGICATAGVGVECGFADWPAPSSTINGVLTWSSNPYTTGFAGGVDLKNNGACGERDFTNTAKLIRSDAVTALASATIHIKYLCQ